MTTIRMCVVPSRAVAVALALVGATHVLCAGCRGEQVDNAWRQELAAWRHPSPLPSFPLVDHRGRTFALRELAGSPVLVAFIFTRCAVPEACPLTIHRVQQTHAQAAGRGLTFLIVTLDPEHDTPAELAAYARRTGLDVPEVTFATGAKEVTDALASLFNVVALRRSAPGGGAELSHPVKLALLNAQLVPQREWLDNHVEPKEILDASFGQ